MRFYKAKQKVRLPAAVILALTVDQIRRRKHLLSIAEGRTVVTSAPVEFKAGEVIGFEQEPRALLPILEPLEYDDDDDDEMFGEGTVGGEANSGSVGADLSAQAKQLSAEAGAKTDDLAEAVKTDLPVDAVKTDDLAEAVKTDLPVDAVKTGGLAEAVKTDLPVDAAKTDELAEAVKTDLPVDPAKTDDLVDAAKSAKKPK